MTRVVRRAVVAALAASSLIVPGAAAAPDGRGVDAPVCDPRAASAANAAAAAGAPLPAPPVGVGGCPQVQPGDYLVSELGDSYKTCVIGFAYRDRRGDTYVTTGADCAPPWAFDDGTMTWPRGRGPAATDRRDGRRIGEFAFRYANGAARLALVRLDRSVIVNPGLCHYGGPIGVAPNTEGPTQAVMAGPQGGIATYDFPPYASSETVVLRPGVAPRGIYGDVALVMGQTLVEDGMPVMTADGLVIGSAEYYAIDQFGSAGFNVGIEVTRPAKPIEVAQKTLRTKLTLLTSPLR